MRFASEWPLLILALLLVGTWMFPMWQWTQSQELAGKPVGRLARLLIGPEQGVCYFFFIWAFLILMTRRSELVRQRRALNQELLPADEDFRLLPEDARLWQRRLSHSARPSGYPTLVGHILELALGKFAISKSPQEVAHTVRESCELAQNRLVASISMVHYLAWAIPAVGFIGTARGMGLALAAAPQLTTDGGLQTFLEETTKSLAFTFDCTLVALALSVVIMFFLHFEQRAEETIVLDTQSYCLERLQNRMVVPDPVHMPAYVANHNVPPPPLMESYHPPPSNYPDRATRDFGHGLGGLS